MKRGLFRRRARATVQTSRPATEPTSFRSSYATSTLTGGCLRAPASFLRGRARIRSPGELTPEQEARVRVQVRAAVRQLRQEQLAVAAEKAFPDVARKAALIVRQQRATHPLHDVLPRRKKVRVHLQAHVLRGEAEVMEPRRVLRGWMERRARHEAVQVPLEFVLLRHPPRRRLRGGSVIFPRPP